LAVIFVTASPPPIAGVTVIYTLVMIAVKGILQ
jgi:hypothetical protein